MAAFLEIYFRSVLIATLGDTAALSCEQSDDEPLRKQLLSFVPRCNRNTTLDLGSTKGRCGSHGRLQPSRAALPLPCLLPPSRRKTNSLATLQRGSLAEMYAHPYYVLNALLCLSLFLFIWCAQVFVFTLGAEVRPTVLLQTTCPEVLPYDQPALWPTSLSQLNPCGESGRRSAEDVHLGCRQSV